MSRGLQSEETPFDVRDFPKRKQDMPIIYTTYKVHTNTSSQRVIPTEDVLKETHR